MRWIRTLVYLQPIQIYGRLWYKIYKPKPNFSPALERRPLYSSWQSPISRKASLLDQFTFKFLNEEQKVTCRKDWDNPNLSKLWRYNLHYFDDLNAIEAPLRNAWHKSLLQRWITENPPAEGTGWEPYPTSLRIINWIKWSLAGNDLPPAAMHSLAVQTRWLNNHIEFHLLGNHLFSNAKALIFAGFFLKGPEADRWCDRGFSILEQQIPEQILEDGGQFELSPMYHSLALEDMIDLLNVCKVYENALSPRWQKVVKNWPELICRMHRWLIVMNHPDGEISFFNDAALGIAPNLLQLEGYAQRLGLQLTRSNSENVTHLDPSGYIRVDQDDMVAILDVGSIGSEYLPAHAHADTLSFELSLFGQRIIVNSGISQYGVDQERNRQRGTAAHNTVVINNQDSSEVWAGFRVGRRAYPKISEVIEENTFVKITASHNGYRWMPGKNVHQRTWLFLNGSIIIEDSIVGDFDEAQMFLYIHPSIKIVDDSNDDRRVILYLQDKKCVLQVEEGNIQIKESTWHPQFGETILNTCLMVNFFSPTLKTTISWENIT